MPDPAPAPRKTLVDQIGPAVGLAGGIAAAGISVFNLLVYWADRDAKLRKEAFDNQLTLARLYSEKFSGPTSCEPSVRFDKELYARATLTLAGLDKERVDQELQSGALAGQRNPIQVMAVLIYTEFGRRDREDCAWRIAPTVAGGGEVANAEAPPPGEAAVYNVSARPAPPVPSGTTTVFIQYRRGTDAAEQRARAVQAALAAPGTGFAAPGIEGVRQVPGRDEIRIYRAADAGKAQALQQRLGSVDPGLARAQIVNLQTAFPNLPAGRMEIWLAGP